MNQLEKLKSDILLEIIHPIISENVQGKKTALLISTMLCTAIFDHISDSGFELTHQDNKNKDNEFTSEDVEFLMRETGWSKGQCLKALINFDGDRDKAHNYLGVNTG